MPLDFSSRAKKPEDAAADFSGRARSPAYFETERGRARATTAADGEPWLEGDDFGGPVSSFKRVEPIFSSGNPIAPPAGGPVAVPTTRTLGERFTTTAEDQANRNLLVAGATAALPRGSYTLPGDPFPTLGAGTLAAEHERERRGSYELMASADPWYKADGGLLGKATAGASTLAGGFTGALADPINLAASAITGGTGLLRQMATQGAVNAGIDAPTQALDVASGAQDGYQPLQTAGAFAFGAGVPLSIRGAQTGLDLGGDLGRAAADQIGKFLRPKATKGADAAPRATAPAPDFSARAKPPADQVGTTGAPDFSGRARRPKGEPRYDPRQLDAQLGDAPIVRPDAPPVFQSSDAEAFVRSTFPGAQITSIKRTPKHNRKVGGADKSWHLSGQAMDIVGVTKEQFRAELEARGLPLTELLDEGDHIHWAWGNREASAPAGKAPPIQQTATSTIAPPLDAPPTRSTATYLDPDGFPVTQAPASARGNFIVRAEPDGTHTVINKSAGWSSVAQGLSRDAAFSRAAELETAASKPPATAHDGVIGEIDQSLAVGKGDATLLANRDIVGFEASLAARGWTRGKKNEWTRPDGASLFIRSQGDSASPVVQWKAPDIMAGAGGPPRDATVPPRREEADWLPEPVEANRSTAPDLTDRALDLLRTGVRARVNRGPTLGEYLAKNGALAPDPDLLAMDASIWHRNRPFQPKLIREGGMDLETAAQKAVEAGYFDDIAPARMDSADNMQAVTADRLREELRREFAGTPRYGREADPLEEDLAAHVDELEQMLHELGLDPASLSNPEIKAALDDYFSTPDQPIEAGRGYEEGPSSASELVRLENGLADQGLIPGVGRATTADQLRAEAARRGGRGGAEALPAGGLWDETAKAQIDLLEAPGGAAAAPGASAVTRVIDGQTVRFPDAAHAALFDFGQRLRDGGTEAELSGQADRLRRSIGRYMDWGEDIAREPGLRAKFEGADRSIPPRKLMYRAAREYAADIEQEPRSASISLYDPDRAADLLRDRGEGVEMAAPAGEKATPSPSVFVSSLKARGPLRDNHLLPLERHTPKLWRESSMDELELFVPGGRASNDVRTTGDLHFADTPDLALGQGRNKGVVMEFDAAGLQGVVATSKPTAKMGYEQGLGSEYVARYNSADAYKKNLRAFRIKKDAEAARHTKIRMRDVFARLEQQGWVRTETADYVQFARPSADAASKKQGMFAGEGAKTAPRESLTDAQSRHSRGDDPREIWRETGWMRGEDGEWRFEISDHDAVLRDAPVRGFFGPRLAGMARVKRMAQRGGSARLDDIMTHPALFEAYPDLRKVRVKSDAKLEAYGQMEGDTLTLGGPSLDDPAVARSVILHEVQHAIQDREGFAVGAPGTPKELRESGYGDALTAEIMRWREGSPIPALEVYHRSAGEIEARNTQTRENMGPKSRRRVHPDTTRDVGRDESIVVRIGEDGRPREMSPERRAELADSWRARRSGGTARSASKPDFTSRATSTSKQAAIDLSAYGSAASASRNISGLRDAPRPGAVAAGKGKAAGDLAGKTVSKLAERLKVALGMIPARQGRMTLKKAVGEYDPSSGVIRTKAVQEIDVLSHELTHRLDGMKLPAMEAAKRAHEKHLKTLAYPDAAKGTEASEGFAEFGRWYVTNPAVAKKLGGAFYDAFENALGKDRPKMLADLREIQAAYQDLLSSASIEVAAASVAHTGRKGPVGRVLQSLKEQGLGDTALEMADRAYYWLVDDLHPLAVAVRKLQRIHVENVGFKRDLKVVENPWALARLARETYALGHSDVLNGVTPYRGVDPEGPALADALEVALGSKMYGALPEKSLRRLDAYLIARRMVHEWARFEKGELQRPPDRNTRAFHEQVIADAEAENPKWADAAKMIYEWNDNLWRKEYEAGLITEAAYKNGLAKPDYVPLMRDISDKTAGSGSKGARGSMQHAGGVKQFKGSTRDVISPLTSMMRRAYELNALIKKNEVIVALDDMAQTAGVGSGAIVERLPKHEMEAVNVDAVEALRKAAEEAGLDARDVTTLVQSAENALGDDTTTKLFRAREMNPRAGESVVFAWRDGVKTPLLLADGEFGRDMFKALAGLTQDQRNGVVDAFAVASQVRRFGVTLSPEFMARNLVRDALATFINTDVGFVPGYHTVKGMAGVVSDNQTARRYAVGGGMRGGVNTAATKRPFPRNDGEALKQLQHLRKKGYKVKRYGSWRGLAELTDLSETSTRLGVAGLAAKQAKKRGLSDYEATLEAAFVSRDYLDFGRRGSRVVSAVRIVTFLNAALQSLDKTTRVLTAGGNLRRVLAPLGKAAPKTATERRALAHAYKAWAKIAALGVLGGSLRALYQDDPEYEEVAGSLRATHWIAKINGEWVFIPKPFEHAELSNIVEREFEHRVLKDPKARERMWADFGYAVVPPYEIAALDVPFAIAKNRDYNGRPIVPEHLKGSVDPELQFNSYTSEFGKRIGKLLGVSPAIVDYTITGYGASMGRYFLQGTNLADERLEGKPQTASGLEDYFLSRAFVRDVTRGSVSQKEFWDQVSKDGGNLTKAEGSFRQLLKDPNKEAEAVAYLNKLDPLERGFVKAKVFSVQGSSAIHPLVRAQGAVSVVGDLRREVRDASLATIRGQEIALTPSQRREADDALSYLAMSEMRNALIATGVKGWAQKQPIPTADAYARLDAVNPQLAPTLRARMLEQKVLPEGLTAQAWGRVRSKWEAPVTTAEGSRLMTGERLMSNDMTAKRREVLRLVQPTQRTTTTPALPVTLPTGLLAGPRPGAGTMPAQPTRPGLLSNPASPPDFSRRAVGR